MKRIMPVLLALFAAATCASAQSCRSRSGYSTYSQGYSYSSPSYSYQSYAAPPYSYAPSVKKETYQETEYVFNKYALVVPLALLPTYSAVYAPPVTPQPQGQAQAPKAAASEMQEIKGQNVQILAALAKLGADVQALGARVESIERGGRFQAPPPPTRGKEPEQILPPPNQDKDKDKGQQQTKLTAALVNKQACAVCHQKGNESFGGDFIISDEKGAFVVWTPAQLKAMAKQLGPTNKMPKLNKRAADHGITRPLTDDEKKALFEEIDRQIDL